MEYYFNDKGEVGVLLASRMSGPWATLEGNILYERALDKRLIEKYLEIKENTASKDTNFYKYLSEQVYKYSLELGYSATPSWYKPYFGLVFVKCSIPFSVEYDGEIDCENVRVLDDSFITINRDLSEELNIIADKVYQIGKSLENVKTKGESVTLLKSCVSDLKWVSESIKEQ